jgi:glutamate synthase domain-containing protein 2/glutamate synthase domain-containing protein 1/glutamate synthase domain-containing protein 3
MVPPQPILPEHDACGVAVIVDRRGRASRAIVERGLEALARLAHRGAIDSRGRSSDGAGILTAVPWEFLAPELAKISVDPTAPRIAAMLTLDPQQAESAIAAARAIMHRAGWDTVIWREVPVRAGALAARLRASVPRIVQCFASARTRESSRSPWRTRLAIETRWRHLGLAGCSIASLSDRTIVYKGLIDPGSLPRLFPDLADARFKAPFAVLHQRFSTNTWPRWDLAQPFHTLAHNGEINTIGGNRMWMHVRLADARIRDAADIVRAGGSDSQSLDAAVEWLRATGLSTPHALARLLPPAWEHDDGLPADVRAFHRYEACFAEPWDGPAAIAFADGRHIGAMVDKNGFRPLRTMTTVDGLVCIASETGVFDLPAATVSSRGRLGPGEMLVVDLDRGTILHGESVIRELARQRDSAGAAGEAPDSHIIRRLERTDVTTPAVDDDRLQRLQREFGWTREEIELIVRPIVCEGQEAVGSMGDDAVLPALSVRDRPLTDYVRQRFAQVTNPPLDPAREAHVMSLRTLLGQRGQWTASPAEPVLLELDSPILLEDELASITANADVVARRVPIGFDAAGGGAALRAALDELQSTAVAAARAGTRIVILSDRDLESGAAPIPALLAAVTVDAALRSARLRLATSFIVETGEIRDAHQTAALCAFGASAVVPYLLYATASELTGRDPRAVERCRKALEGGLRRILSKMGVCSFEAYSAARLFYAIGLDEELGSHFGEPLADTVTLRGRLSLDDLAATASRRRQQASLPRLLPLAHPGYHTFRRDGDQHGFNPALVRHLHETSGRDDANAYQAFAALTAGREPNALRDLLEFAPAEPVPVDDVEPVEDICRRFFASAMSVGALSPEAHRTIATAMNRIGARSNSGEGGEEPERQRPNTDATARSATKQVASARFGVTPAYLISCTELQIKIAQGSKPGEGGQLPAGKVDALIARLRHTRPGTALISPPPHHDIYSIEDLAQLIHDLRCFHPRARINVKLVSQPGIGVIAAGVVKAGADAIQISGHEGGTGASPRGSIKHAGAPWELGLSEAHRSLVAAGLRPNVVLQTDGGLQTGRDVAIAAALGADEFGFGTAALVAVGCVMARQCHLNTCPVGIASQRPELRARFTGSPEMLVRYLRLVAQDVRQVLASLGLRRVADLVGRADLLASRRNDAIVDATALIAESRSARVTPRRTRRPAPHADSLDRVLDSVAQGRLGIAPIRFIGRIRNTDRSVGARLAGRLAMQSGNRGTAHAPVEVRLTGSAGQSLWAFALPGMHVRVEGDANDGVGKGMHGGEIVVRPPHGNRAPEPVLVGNAALYGATGGRMFVAGRAGERFAVRNSGAWAVVEGLGDHGCEYMTGGAVLVLGSVGRNFAAGLTGGIAYVLDHEGFEGHLHAAGITLRRGLQHEESWIRAWLAEHHERSGSDVAAEILCNWTAACDRFWVVTPASVGQGFNPAKAGSPEGLSHTMPVPTAPVPTAPIPTSVAIAAARVRSGSPARSRPSRSTST